MRNRLLPQLGIGLAVLLSASAGRAGSLPTTPELDAWFASLAGLDLESPQTHLRLAGKTSVYLEVSLEGQKGVLGAFLVQNSAANPETELVAFSLARILGRSELAGPAVRRTLKTAALQRFRALLEAKSFENAQREANRLSVLKAIAASPDALEGVYKRWSPVKPRDYEGIGRNETLNPDDPYVKFLRPDGPLPSAAPTTLPGIPGSESELELARQLSTIFVLDVLTGQWDRFSGGNLQAFALGNGKVQFVALDNGGGELDGSDLWLDRYLGWTGRFEKGVAKKLLELDAFVNGGGGPYLGFTERDKLLDEIGLKASSRKHFARKLGKLAAHVKALVQRYGEPAVYFPE
jgi:hypothetical protein